MSKTSKKPKKKKSIYQTVKGMHDILPKEEEYWRPMLENGWEISSLHDFTYMETPILEKAELFTTGIGEHTDIIEKEMFAFTTRGKEQVVLRPEGTTPIMRSYLGNHLGHFASPLKVFYWGPMFRYERPQAGRFRQFHQWGYEIIGDGDPFYDVQIILVTLNFLSALKIKDVNVKINTVGCKVCRPTYRKKLIAFYRANKKKICEDCERRLDKNPLRLLDCKEKDCRELREEAPIILNHLCQSCNTHFKAVLELVEENVINYEPDPYLVRGLDYYSRTVFEVTLPDKPDFALAGGGRYDYLSETLGAGRAIPAVGVSLGLERLISYIKDQKIDLNHKKKPSAFFVIVGEEAKKRGICLMNELRGAGVRVLENVGKKSLGNQLKSADRAKSKISLIFGQKECFEDTIIIRDMKTGAQETIPLARIVTEVKKRLR